MVDWEWWAEPDISYIQTRWRAPWNHYQGHQVLCEGDLLRREEKSWPGCWLLGLIRRVQGRCVRQDNYPQIVRSEDSWVESILWQFPQWDEEYIYWGAQEVREEGAGSKTDETRPWKGSVHDKSAGPDVIGDFAQTKNGSVQTLAFRWYHRGLWELALIRKVRPHH